LLNVMFLLLGVSALIVALALAWLLLRVGRTLSRAEELMEATTEGLQDTLPKMSRTIGNVNDITEGVTVGLSTAGRGAARAGDRVRATWYGVKVAGQSLWRSYVNGTVATSAQAPEARIGRRTGGGAGGQ
jgi:hypothetical protein